jgi:hypothetical protein
VGRVLPLAREGRVQGRRPLDGGLLRFWSAALLLWSNGLAAKAAKQDHNQSPALDLQELMMTNRKSAPRGRPPLTAAGMASYAGLLAGYDITIEGTLPKGDTTRTVTHLILERTSNTLVGQVVLPDAVQQNNLVSVRLKVPDVNKSYVIGTFDGDEFHESSFLSIRNPTSNRRPGGAVGTIPGGAVGTITGTLPKGVATQTVTYFITDSNTIVGQIELPDAVQQNNSVSVTVKVPNASASYAVGTFDSDGFHASSFLSVRNPKVPTGAVGPTW